MVAKRYVLNVVAGCMYASLQHRDNRYGYGEEASESQSLGAT